MSVFFEDFILKTVDRTPQIDPNNSVGFTFTTTTVTCGFRTFFFAHREWVFRMLYEYYRDLGLQTME